MACCGHETKQPAKLETMMTFGVSCTSVGEASPRLQVAGVVETYRGPDTFVLPSPKK